MSDKYTLIHEGLNQWINSPNNGGECCQSWADTVDELNRLLARINRWEDACDEAIAFCELLNPVAQTPNIPELIAKNLRKAKEAKL